MENGNEMHDPPVDPLPSHLSILSISQNPSRKADDGWTSCKYKGQLLSLFWPQLEALVASGAAIGGPSAGGAARTGSGRASPPPAPRLQGVG